MSDIDPIGLAQALVRCASITPRDEGALDALQATLEQIGFRCRRLPFGEGDARVDNLFARWGEQSPAFAYAGHTDVVPLGDVAAWSHPPFDARIVDGMLFGRGAADMKGSIAAFAVAAARIVQRKPKGSIVLIITGDEEGPATNGTVRVLKWMREAGERFDHCLVGEPTSAATLGDMMKVGRRGSMNCRLFVEGRQGHVAYPERAANPTPVLARMIAALGEAPLDAGYERFQPSNIEATDLFIGNPAHNVIPARAEARFNVRFNPNWTAASLETELRRRLEAVARPAGVQYALDCVCSGEAFLTTDKGFIDLVASVVAEKTGLQPERSTTGGTSDARFIRYEAPVCEFGLVGATIHKIDECASVDDIARLSDIYEAILERYFVAHAC
jgi:succinyl-diaminopimelate desuccinylase